MQEWTSAIPLLEGSQPTVLERKRTTRKRQEQTASTSDISRSASSIPTIHSPFPFDPQTTTLLPNAIFRSIGWSPDLTQSHCPPLGENQPAPFSHVCTKAHLASFPLCCVVHMSVFYSGPSLSENRGLERGGPLTDDLVPGIAGI